jgi:hypothetical protein
MTPSGIKTATFRLVAQFIYQLSHCVPLLHKLNTVHFEGMSLKTWLQQKSTVCFRYIQFAVCLYSKMSADIPYVLADTGITPYVEVMWCFAKSCTSLEINSCQDAWKSRLQDISLHYYFFVNFFHVDSWRWKRKADEEWNGFADEFKGNVSKVTDFSFKVRG